jgi:hypothetical protein
MFQIVSLKWLIPKNRDSSCSCWITELWELPPEFHLHRIVSYGIKYRGLVPQEDNDRFTPIPRTNHVVEEWRIVMTPILTLHWLRKKLSVTFSIISVLFRVVCILQKDFQYRKRIGYHCSAAYGINWAKSVSENIAYVYHTLRKTPLLWAERACLTCIIPFHFIFYLILCLSLAISLLRLSLWEGSDGDRSQTGWKSRDGLHSWLRAERHALQGLVHGDISHHIGTVSTIGVRYASLPGNYRPTSVTSSAHVLRVFLTISVYIGGDPGGSGYQDPPRFSLGKVL